MIWERDQGRKGRPCCGRCFTPFGCARPAHHETPCGCHVQQGIACRRPGCGVGLFVSIPRDSDLALAEVRERLRAEWGITGQAHPGVAA